ncbi:MAG: DUF4276 family protein [Gemmataceae bacterium]|nr:DUF4276 family protein [Gemmataceae bacterium]MCI0740853.1 DUF4276 family protein [Gemmataceae bacterium]
MLQPHLFPQSDGLIHTLAVGEKDHHHLYGLGTKKKYMGDKGVRKFICNTIKHRQGKNVYFTTFFDLYALPNDFPGKAANVRNPANPTPYVVALEDAFRLDINYYRFIPYLQLHEYETMLFADPDAFRKSFENCEDEIQELKAIATSEPNIEHINDGKDTAPSKRIIEVLPGYDGRKSSAGPDIAAFIGLAKIREKCPHVHSWLLQLEGIKWEA